jgi:hypothetical protein
MTFGRMGALGRGFGRMGSGGVIAEALAPAAVVLIWDEDSADTRPDFDVDLPSGQGAPLDAEADDVLRIQYRLQSGVDADYATYLTDTLDAGEVAGDTITVSGVDPLTGGAYYFRARLERDAAYFGVWSNVESVNVAPQITSTNSANNAENSTLAKALTADETVTWSIVGGADQARFELSGSTLRWASNGTKDYETPNDADTNNTYVVNVRATSVATGVTTDQAVTVTVTDVAEGGVAPVLTSPIDTVTGSTTADLGVTTDQDNGTLYWVVTTSSTGPTAAQVKLGQDHTGSAAAASGSQAVSATGAQVANDTGLTANTAYFAHFMHENAATDQSNVADFVPAGRDPQGRHQHTHRLDEVGKHLDEVRFLVRARCAR